MTRRDTLRWLGNGFGSLALADALMGATGSGAAALPSPHFTPKAKRVIFLFLNGGMSQVDTFDPKPMLDKHHGEPMPGPKIVTDRASGNLMRSPFEFKRHGQSGMEVSEIFPQVGRANRRYLRDSVVLVGQRQPRTVAVDDELRSRVARTAIYGFLAHVRTGFGKPQPSRIHRSLPRLSGARPAVMDFGVSAGQSTKAPTSRAVSASRRSWCGISATRATLRPSRKRSWPCWTR